jgi:hypothetical protein
MLTLTFPTPRNVAKWRATTLVDDDGTIFVPACCHRAGEFMGLMFSSQDGIGYILHHGHPFLPLDWFVKDCPEDMETWSNIRKMVERETQECPE